VDKICIPPADPGLFNLRIDGTTYGPNQPCGGSTGPITVGSGPHTVSETAGTGTNLADYTTTFGGNCATDGTITLAAGENKTCTITNERAGTIIIRKSASPQSTQAFDFNCAFLGPFQLDDDGAEGNPLNSSQTFTGLTPGNYDCSEAQVTGWVISIACTDPDNGTTIGSPTAHIDIDGGETVECTFTNTFVPGEQVVGGIMGLLDTPDTPARSESNENDGGLARLGTLALMALALGGFAGAVGLRRVRRGA
jgi:hypothetical protein